MSITTKDFANKPMAWIQEFDLLGYLPFIWWIIDSFFHCRGSPEEPSFIPTNKWLSVSIILVFFYSFRINSIIRIYNSSWSRNNQSAYRRMKIAFIT